MAVVQALHGLVALAGGQRLAVLGVGGIGVVEHVVVRAGVDAGPDRVPAGADDGLQAVVAIGQFQQVAARARVEEHDGGQILHDLGVLVDQVLIQPVAYLDVVQHHDACQIYLLLLHERGDSRGPDRRKGAQDIPLAGGSSAVCWRQ
jgi:hypothetical protein